MKRILFILPFALGIVGCAQHSHSFGEWVSDSETQHKRTCTTCNFVEYEDHKFGEGVIEDGKKTFTCSICSYKKYEDNPSETKVTINGLAGCNNKSYKSLKDAYTDAKAFLESNGGLSNDSLNDDEFKTVFTDVSEGKNAKLTITIQGDTELDNYKYSNFLTFGRTNRSYGGGKSISEVCFQGFDINSTLNIKSNSADGSDTNMSFPFDDAGLDNFILKFDTLKLVDETNYIRFKETKLNSAYTVNVNNCTIYGGFDFFSNHEGCEYIYTGNTFTLSKSNAAIVYAVKNTKANFQGSTDFVFNNNKVSAHLRGINVEYLNGTATFLNNEISITDDTRSCIQLSAISSATISGNKLTGTNGIDLRTAAEITLEENDFSKCSYVIHTNKLVDEDVSLSIDNTKPNIYGEADKTKGWDKDNNKAIPNCIAWPDENLK